MTSHRQPTNDTGKPVSLVWDSSRITSTRQNMSFEMVLLRPLASVAPIGVVKLSQKFSLEGHGEENRKVQSQLHSCTMCRR